MSHDALLTTPQLRLVVGVIVDSEKPERAVPLMDDLARLAPEMDSLDVVLLDNGGLDGFARVLERAREAGLVTWTLDVGAQQTAAHELDLPESDTRANKTIAVARTLLQRFVHAVICVRTNAIAWILDDDLRIHLDGSEIRRLVEGCRERGVSVAIGNIVGAPPVPSASTVRVQLVDVFHFLAGARHHDPEAPPPDHGSNERWTRDRRDYYYDLARNETDRLETPFVPDTAATTLREAVRSLVDRTPRILAGELVTRAIRPSGTDAWSTTYLRGGNTLVLDVDLLRDVPNLAPLHRGRRVRRSDMLWALHADRALGRRVVRAPFALTQDRTMERAAMEPAGKLVEDIVGYAFFRACEAVATRQPEELRRHMKKFANERLAAYRLSFHRARGLVRSLRHLIGQQPWWAYDEAQRERLEQFLEGCDDALTDARLEEVERGVLNAVTELEIEAYLAEHQQLGTRHATLASVTTWVETQRERRARAVIRDTGISADEVLGMGAEGVVLRAGDHAFKVFDGWSRHESTSLLERLVVTSCEAFPRVHAIHRVRDLVVLEYAYELSEPYRGGCGAALVSALRSLRAAGWAHTNLHPKNLRINESGALRIIDLGRSIIEHAEAAEALMVRRAFLAWRFAFRSDLDELMRRSLQSEDFPELVGWRALLDEVRAAPAKQRLDRELARLVESSGAKTVLDFGAGKPRRIHAAAPERSWVAFDLDEASRSRWTAEAPSVRFVDESELDAMIADSVRFDAVVCGLVLCSLDSPAIEHVLARIRALLGDEGRAWIAVCDPTSVHVEATTDFERVGTSFPYGECAPHGKLVRETQSIRREVHRPLSDYRRAFARVALLVEDERTIDGLDARRLERISEFRIFQVRALPQLSCSTSLLVKVCGMDHETLTAAVEHLTRQLGSPRAFSEVVVVVDPRSDGFARAHRPSDLPRLRMELQRLVARGVIDRIIEGPSDGAASQTIAREWFHLEATAAHSTNGQPALAFLAALAACKGDLVLHADIDVLVARPDRHVDLILEARDVFEHHIDAVALSLPVYGDVEPVVRDRDRRGPFRIDATCGWIHRQRLLDLRPLPNDLAEGRLALPWHRAVDRAVQSGGGRSLRKGARGAWFAHPDNVRKIDVDAHLLVLDRAEANHAPEIQTEHADLRGSLASWCGPARDEAMVVVVMGRNVSPGRVRRCVESLQAQTRNEWGAIFVDDASDNGMRDLLADASRELAERVTIVTRRRRAGLLSNLVLAVRHFITRPDAIVVLLDLDDALAPGALARIGCEHDDGADVTVGSMVRTDKESCYQVDFTDPRGKRGGNVWLHARSFRKSLFDRIARRDLEVDGRWIDVATDWAFMLPIIEMATKPVWLREPIYLHEPSEPRDGPRRQLRERNIASIVRKASYRRSAVVPSLTVLGYHRVTDGNEPALGFYRARGLVVSPRNLEVHLRGAAARGFEPVRLSDVERAFRDGLALPPRALLVTFDDGYADAEPAAVLALKLGFPVALFVRMPVTDGFPTWAPLDLLYHTRASRGEIPVASPQREALLERPVGEQLGYAADGVAREVAASWRARLYLSELKLRELANPDVELGVHGIDHVRWTNLDDDELRAQIDRPLRWLSKRSCAVAYPDGAVDANVARVAQAAGVSLGFVFGTDPPCGVPPRFGIRRLAPVDDPTWLDRTLATMESES
jgi:peptidoglycan/xylan/chitin deacetylase (PgdA/CDA1 family)